MILASSVSKGSVRARTGMQSPRDRPAGGGVGSRSPSIPHSPHSPGAEAGEGEGKAEQANPWIWPSCGEQGQIKCSRPHTVQAGASCPPFSGPGPHPQPTAQAHIRRLSGFYKGKCKTKSLGSDARKDWCHSLFPNTQLENTPNLLRSEFCFSKSPTLEK